MAWIDVFNGDADGLCALIQLRLAQPVPSRLVTGAKRDTRLLRAVTAQPGDCITVLDVSLDSNSSDVQRLLASGARLRYFDHHFAGNIMSHDALEIAIDTSPEVCTSLIVNRYLGGRHAAWAVVGAFGDNLAEQAGALAADIGLDAGERACLRQLGELVNYNSYGTRLDDLHFHPGSLFLRLVTFDDPRAALGSCTELEQLAAGCAADLQEARRLKASIATQRVAAYVLPDAAWARRVVGTWANEISREFPDRAHLVLCPDGDGTFSVSVRAARARPRFAAAFCRRYPNGGGREAAAGINCLQPSAQHALLRDFCATFG